MTASKRRSTSSHTETPPSGEQQAPAGNADMQRMFEAWMGAWRSFADPSKWPAAAQAAQMQGTAQQAAM